MDILTTSRGVFTLRPAREADASAFRDLRLEALHNHLESFSSDYATNYEHPSAFWSERLRSLGSEGIIYFATQNDRLIGMCGIHRGESQRRGTAR